MKPRIRWQFVVSIISQKDATDVCTFGGFEKTFGTILMEILVKCL